MRLRMNDKIKLSEDTLGEESVYDRDYDDDELTDTLVEAESHLHKIAFGVTKSFIVSPSAKFLYIETNKKLNFKFNGGSEILPIEPIASTVAGENLPGRLKLFTSGITAFQLINPGATSADDATVNVVFGG